jgi:hypothetical protein
MSEGKDFHSDEVHDVFWRPSFYAVNKIFSSPEITKIFS